MIQKRTSLETIAALMCVSLSCSPAQHPEMDAPEASVALPGVSGAALPMASAEELGFSEVGLDHMQSTMQSFVDDDAPICLCSATFQEVDVRFYTGGSYE